MRFVLVAFQQEGSRQHTRDGLVGDDTVAAYAAKQETHDTVLVDTTVLQLSAQESPGDAQRIAQLHSVVTVVRLKQSDLHRQVGDCFLAA